MSDHIIPHFQNSDGNRAIEIGVKEFMCVGANPPFDHPHVFIDMGADAEAVCPYCSTLYRYNAKLDATTTIPAGCAYVSNSTKVA
ncbi:zinc-finger domain-containing protein [Brucellaceae bacterium C25G]